MPKIYPIGGGKGGVGKSFITASLGALIAKLGKKVVLVDLDLGASNLHTFLGLPAPKIGLNHYLNKQEMNLADVAVQTHINNLFFISSCHCSMEIANLYYAQKVKLIKAVQSLPFDYILIDLGAGTNFNTLDFFLSSNNGVFVCTPEPTSIENAFRFIKAAYLRKLKQLVKRHAFDTKVKTAVPELESGAQRSDDLIEMVLKHDPAKEAFLKESIGRFQFNLILNQFRKNADIALGEKIKTVCNRHFYSPFVFLGRVAFDERVIDSIYARKLYVKNYPAAASAVELKQIAELLTNHRQTPPNPSS